jgi:hypothetical protein
MAWCDVVWRGVARVRLSCPVLCCAVCPVTECEICEQKKDGEEGGSYNESESEDDDGDDASVASGQ